MTCASLRNPRPARALTASWYQQDRCRACDSRPLFRCPINKLSIPVGKSESMVRYWKLLSEGPMSSRIDKSWLVFDSIENDNHDRCVDLFLRPDNTYGFEEFRRDFEDSGAWTPVQYYSGAVFQSKTEALTAAMSVVTWLADNANPS